MAFGVRLTNFGLDEFTDAGAVEGVLDHLAGGGQVVILHRQLVKASEHGVDEFPEALFGFSFDLGSTTAVELTDEATADGGA